jgi:MFS family permease
LYILVGFLLVFFASLPPQEGPSGFPFIFNIGSLIGIVVLLTIIEFRRRIILKEVEWLEEEFVKLGHAEVSAQRIRKIILYLGIDDILVLTSGVLVIIAVFPLLMSIFLIPTGELFLLILPYAVGVIAIGLVMLFIAQFHKRVNWKKIVSLNERAAVSKAKPLSQ